MLFPLKVVLFLREIALFQEITNSLICEAKSRDISFRKMQQERNSKLFLWAKRVAFERKTAYPILVLNSISEDIKSKICISRGTQKKTGKWGHKLQDTYICKSSGLNEEKMHCTEEKTFHMELINIKKFMTKPPTNIQSDLSYFLWCPGEKSRVFVRYFCAP